MRTPILSRLVTAALLVTLAGAAAMAAQPAAGQQTATQFYLAYRTAFDKAKTLDEILPYMASKNRAQVEATPAADREKMFGMVKIMNTLTDVKVIKEARNPDGGATLTVEGVDADKNKSAGTVDIVKEGGAWKIGQESWKTKS
jgi:hypothetical protein